MRQSHTAVIERHRVLSGEFASEPHEAGWAGEARWFVQVLSASHPSAKLVLTTQISPDGLHWCDAGIPAQVASGECLVSWPVREFGQWLRVTGFVEAPHSIESSEASVKVLIYLTLKS